MPILTGLDALMDTWEGDSMDNGVTRRQVLWGLGSAALASGAPSAPPEVDSRVVARNDAALDNLLRAQVTDPRHARLGAVPDDYLMYHAGAAGSLIETAAASWIAPHSRHRGAPEVLERIRLAAQFLERSQSAEGNIDLLSTNFNSPPDTGFVVHNVATAAAIARRYSHDEVLRLLQPFRRGNGIGRHPHTESPMGRLLRTGPGERAVSQLTLRRTHSAMAG